MSRFPKIGTAAPVAAAKEKGAATSGRPEGLQPMANVEALARPGKEFSVNSPDRNAHLWLEDQIARAQGGIVTQVISLTPAFARILLARNANNRKLSDQTIERYARDITNDAWVFNGEPVIVSREGLLNDGQHRCEAVIAADKAIDIVLVIGTDRDSRFTIDQGRTRMVGDYLGMNGHVDGIALGAAAGYVWQHRERGRLSNQTSFKATKGEIVAVVEQNPDLSLSLASISKKGSDSIGGRSLLAFCHWVFSRRASLPEVDAFFAYLVTGQNLSATDPILYARNRLITTRGRLRPNEKAELIFRAWNAWRRGEKPKTLTIGDGPLPVPER